jgi:hypothetical protein
MSRRERCLTTIGFSHLMLPHMKRITRNILLFKQ